MTIHLFPLILLFNCPDEPLFSVDLAILILQQVSCHLCLIKFAFMLPIQVPFSKVVYIEHTDFRVKDSKDYYGLAPGKTVLLRYTWSFYYMLFHNTIRQDTS